MLNRGGIIVTALAGQAVSAHPEDAGHTLADQRIGREPGGSLTPPPAQRPTSFERFTVPRQSRAAEVENLRAYYIALGLIRPANAVPRFRRGDVVQMNRPVLDVGGTVNKVLRKDGGHWYAVHFPVLFKDHGVIDVPEKLLVAHPATGSA